MAKKPSWTETANIGHSSTSAVIGGSVDANGREVWHVTADGQPRSLITTSSSAQVMDEAVKAYVGALERLAKR